MSVISNLKFTHDPAGAATVLLDYGDRMVDWAATTGGQSVQEIPGLRVDGIDTATRYNEKHTLSIGKLVAITGSVASALLLLRHSASVPKTTADIKIEIETHTTSYFLLRNCTVESFPAETKQSYVLKKYVFKGGLLEEITI